jgi:hypothetical protein
MWSRMATHRAVLAARLCVSWRAGMNRRSAPEADFAVVFTLAVAEVAVVVEVNLGVHCASPQVPHA